MAGISQVQVDRYTSGGSTWTKQSWAQYVRIVLIGGGGSGGGGPKIPPHQLFLAAAEGAGQVLLIWF